MTRAIDLPPLPPMGPLTAEQSRELGVAKWADAHGIDYRKANVALSTLASRQAIRNWQRDKEAVRFAPPRAAQGRFPFNHRTLAEVPVGR